MSVKTLSDVNLSGKRVLVRCDFNVPLKGGDITDFSRIDAALPTIQYLVEQSASVILCSHLGRPKGKQNADLSLAPVAEAISARISKPVTFIEDTVGPLVENELSKIGLGDIALLENLRFYAEEESNDDKFSSLLGELADAYVNDAFGTAHRAHASTHGVTKYLSPCVSGFLIEKELSYLGDKTSNPER